jgi:hypothetical protein
MNSVKNIAQKDWLRWTLGGVVTGGMNYGLFHNSPEIALIAVPIAVLIGAFWCINPERIVPSMVQAGIAGLMLILTHHTTTKIMMNDTQWWKVAPVGLFLGLLGGVSVGALLGGVCRHFWEP